VILNEKLSDHFGLSEFTVSARYPELAEPVPDHLLNNVRRLVTEVLEPIRRLWHPMTVLSGYRSEKLNKAVGGSATSQHRNAEAADIRTQNVRGLFMAMLARQKKFPTGQVIGYPANNFVHIALPSQRYPVPTFFIATGPKRYQQVSNLDEATRLWKA
jgi:uncharacterized protein YcbK (DUF882 family)